MNAIEVRDCQIKPSSVGVSTNSTGTGSSATVQILREAEGDVKESALGAEGQPPVTPCA